MVNMKKSALPKVRPKSPPTRPAPLHRKGGGSVMGEPFAGSPIAFNQGSGCKIRKKFALPKVRQIKKAPTGVFFIWWRPGNANPYTSRKSLP